MAITSKPAPVHAGVADIATAEIVALEKAALTRWIHGDPSGFLEICRDDVVYFDPLVERRINGLVELTRLYESIRGKINADRFELLDPKVQLAGDAAVLTFNFVSYSGGQESRWNCTEVYAKSAAGWQIVQTHWSITQSALK